MLLAALADGRAVDYMSFIACGLLQCAVITCILLDREFAFAGLQRNAVRPSLQHNFDSVTITPKLLPMVLQYLWRQNVITQVPILVLGQQHQHVDWPVLQQKSPAPILFRSGVQANFSSSTSYERTRPIFLKRISSIDSLQPF